MKLNRKAQAISLQSAPRFVLILILLGMLLGAGIIALSAFRTTARETVAAANNFTAVNATNVDFSVAGTLTCSGVTIINSTLEDTTSKFVITNCEALLTDNSQTATNHRASYTAIRTSAASDALNNSMRGAINISTQLPTVGTLVGVGLILVVVIGVFAFMAIKSKSGF